MVTTINEVHESRNPDSRPLPANWVQRYDAERKFFYYVDLSANPQRTSSIHPMGPMVPPGHGQQLYAASRSLPIIPPSSPPAPGPSLPRKNDSNHPIPPSMESLIDGQKKQLAQYATTPVDFTSIPPPPGDFHDSTLERKPTLPAYTIVANEISSISPQPSDERSSLGRVEPVTGMPSESNGTLSLMKGSGAPDVNSQSIPQPRPPPNSNSLRPLSARVLSGPRAGPSQSRSPRNAAAQPPSTSPASFSPISTPSSILSSFSLPSSSAPEINSNSPSSSRVTHQSSISVLSVEAVPVRPELGTRDYARSLYASSINAASTVTLSNAQQQRYIRPTSAAQEAQPSSAISPRTSFAPRQLMTMAAPSSQPLQNAELDGTRQTLAENQATQGPPTSLSSHDRQASIPVASTIASSAPSPSSQLHSHESVDTTMNRWSDLQNPGQPPSSAPSPSVQTSPVSAAFAQPSIQSTAPSRAGKAPYRYSTAVVPPPPSVSSTSSSGSRFSFFGTDVRTSSGPTRSNAPTTSNSSKKKFSFFGQSIQEKREQDKRYELERRAREEAAREREERAKQDVLQSSAAGGALQSSGQDISPSNPYFAVQAGATLSPSQSPRAQAQVQDRGIGHALLNAVHPHTHAPGQYVYHTASHSVPGQTQTSTASSIFNSVLGQAKQHGPQALTALGKLVRTAKQYSNSDFNSSSSSTFNTNDAQSNSAFDWSTLSNFDLSSLGIDPSSLNGIDLSSLNDVDFSTIFSASDGNAPTFDLANTDSFDFSSFLDPNTFNSSDGLNQISFDDNTIFTNQDTIFDTNLSASFSDGLVNDYSNAMDFNVQETTDTSVDIPYVDSGNDLAAMQLQAELDTQTTSDALDPHATFETTLSGTDTSDTGGLDAQNSTYIIDVVDDGTMFPVSNTDDVGFYASDPHDTLSADGDFVAIDTESSYIAPSDNDQAVTSFDNYAQLNVEGDYELPGYSIVADQDLDASTMNANDSLIGDAAPADGSGTGLDNDASQQLQQSSDQDLEDEMRRTEEELRRAEQQAQAQDMHQLQNIQHQVQAEQAQVMQDLHQHIQDAQAQQMHQMQQLQNTQASPQSAPAQQTPNQHRPPTHATQLSSSTTNASVPRPPHSGPHYQAAQSTGRPPATSSTSHLSDSIYPAALQHTQGHSSSGQISQHPHSTHTTHISQHSSPIPHPKPGVNHNHASPSHSPSHASANHTGSHSASHSTRPSSNSQTASTHAHHAQVQAETVAHNHAIAELKKAHALELDKLKHAHHTTLTKLAKELNDNLLKVKTAHAAQLAQVSSHASESQRAVLMKTQLGLNALKTDIIALVKSKTPETKRDAALKVTKTLAGVEAIIKQGLAAAGHTTSRPTHPTATNTSHGRTSSQSPPVLPARPPAYPTGASGTGSAQGSPISPQSTGSQATRLNPAQQQALAAQIAQRLQAQHTGQTSSMVAHTQAAAQLQSAMQGGQPDYTAALLAQAQATAALQQQLALTNARNQGLTQAMQQQQENQLALDQRRVQLQERQNTAKLVGAGAAIIGGVVRMNMQ